MNELLDFLTILLYDKAGCLVRDIIRSALVTFWNLAVDHEMHDAHNHHITARFMSSRRDGC